MAKDCSEILLLMLNARWRYLHPSDGGGKKENKTNINK